jgi:hypothetical protein
MHRDCVYSRETGYVALLEQGTSSNPVDAGWHAVRTRLSCRQAVEYGVLRQ